MEKFVVSKDPAVFEAWPDLCRGDNDRLICVFNECTAHMDRTNERIAYVISDDRGRTWSEKRYLTEPGSNDAFYSGPRISRLSDGTLAVVCDFMAGWDSEISGIGLKVFLWLSRDNGETWAEPVLLPIVGVCPEHIRQFPDGRWLTTAHLTNPATKKTCQYAWYSDDNGKTWSDRVCVADDPRYNFFEGSLLIVDDTTVVCYMREESKQGWDCLKSISRDRGETWEGVYNVPLPGCHRPTVGWLSGGQVLLTYRQHQGAKNPSENLMGALIPRESILETSRDFQTARIFPLVHDRSLKADCGYSGWVQFDDGEIVVVTYLTDDAPIAWIQALSFRLEEFVLNADQFRRYVHFDGI